MVPSSPVPFPLDDASPTIRMRVVRDLWDETPPSVSIDEVLKDGPVVELAASQRKDGTWQSWLHHGGLSTENAVGELAERGCPPDRGPLARAIPRLRAFVEGDPFYFVDLRGRHKPLLDGFLRRLALSLLAHAGLGAEEDVRVAADREVDRTHAWVERARRDGLPVDADDRHRPDAIDAYGLPVPDLHWLRLVAFTPSLRGDPRVRDVLDYVAGDEYQRLAQSNLGQVIDGGRPMVCGWGIALPSPESLLDAGVLSPALWLTELFLLAGAPDPVRGLAEAIANERSADGLIVASNSVAKVNPSYGILSGFVRLSTPWRPPARTIDLTFRALRIEKLLAATTP